MGIARFVVLTTIGSAVWVVTLAFAGHALGSEWRSVRHAFEYVDYVIVAMIVVGVVYAVVQRRRDVARQVIPPSTWSSEQRTASARHAVALGLIQGPAELLPISSSSHTALIPWLMRWRSAALDVELRRSLEVALHGGTAAALLAGGLGSLAAERPPVHSLLFATAPPAAAGFLLERSSTAG